MRCGHLSVAPRRVRLRRLSGGLVLRRGLERPPALRGGQLPQHDGSDRRARLLSVSGGLVVRHRCDGSQPVRGRHDRVGREHEHLRCVRCRLVPGDDRADRVLTVPSGQLLSAALDCGDGVQPWRVHVDDGSERVRGVRGGRVSVVGQPDGLHRLSCRLVLRGRRECSDCVLRRQLSQLDPRLAAGRRDGGRRLLCVSRWLCVPERCRGPLSVRSWDDHGCGWSCRVQQVRRWELPVGHGRDGVRRLSGGLVLRRGLERPPALRGGQLPQHDGSDRRARLLSVSGGLVVRHRCDGSQPVRGRHDRVGREHEHLRCVRCRLVPGDDRADRVLTVPSGQLLSAALDCGDGVQPWRVHVDDGSERVRGVRGGRVSVVGQPDGLHRLSCRLVLRGRRECSDCVLRRQLSQLDPRLAAGRRDGGRRLLCVSRWLCVPERCRGPLSVRSWDDHGCGWSCRVQQVRRWELPVGHGRDGVHGVSARFVLPARCGGSAAVQRGHLLERNQLAERRGVHGDGSGLLQPHEQHRADALCGWHVRGSLGEWHVHTMHRWRVSGRGGLDGLQALHGRLLLLRGRGGGAAVPGRHDEACGRGDDVGRRLRDVLEWHVLSRGQCERDCVRAGHVQP